MNDPTGLIALVILGTLLIIVLAWYFGAANRLKRRLRATPAVAIGALAENTEGRVIGAAQIAGHALFGPLTGRPCVYYIAKVEELRSTGRSSYWKTVIHEQRGVPFVIADDSGRAVVDPVAAQVALTFDSNSTVGLFHDADPVQADFLARHQVAAQGWLFNKKMRFREAMIEVGETVAVVGQGVREPDPDAAPTAEYRGTVPTRLRLTRSAKYPLLISDDPSTTQR